MKTERLSSIADEKTRFIKIDKDGYDFKILMNCIEWLAAAHPAILFEDQIQNADDLDSRDRPVCAADGNRICALYCMG